MDDNRPLAGSVPSFAELPVESQSRALLAISGIAVGEKHAAPLAVDESKLPAATREKVVALTADGFQVVLSESRPLTKREIAEIDNQQKAWRKALNAAAKPGAAARRVSFQEWMQERAPELTLERLAQRIVVGDPAGAAPPTGYAGLGRTLAVGTRKMLDGVATGEMHMGITGAWFGAVLAALVGTIGFGPYAGLIALWSTLLIAAFLVGLKVATPARYALTHSDRKAIARAAVQLSWDTDEVKLAGAADVIADEILALPAWSSDYLTSQRVTFDPAAEASEITRHAHRIAVMRTRIAGDPGGHGPEQDAARVAVAEQHQVLDVLTESLRRRVAALWSYRQTLGELDGRLAALRALESTIALSPELDALAQQLGADELATDRLAARTEEARALTNQVEQLVTLLQSTLGPRPHTTGPVLPGA